MKYNIWAMDFAMLLRETAIDLAGGEQRVVSQLDEIEFHVGYAEPGYGGSEPENTLIATGNWNPVDTKDEEGNRVNGFDIQDRKSPFRLTQRLADSLERLGFELEWNDEWMPCYDCGKLVRTQADSYHWKPSYIFIQGDCVCHECICKDPDALFEELEGTQRPLTLDINPEEHGYELIEMDFERGLHPGQADNPKLIAERLEEIGLTKFFFRLDSVGQFDARFSVYVNSDEMGENEETAASVGDYLARGKLADDVDPATMMIRALKSIPPPTGTGIQVASVDVSTGTANVRQVSAQEFVEGRALDRPGAPEES